MTGTEVATVQVGGITVTSAQTAEERFKAICEANVQPSQSQAFVPPSEYKNAIGGKAPPPTPKQLEKANKPANVAPYDAKKVAAFDADQRAAGNQTAPPRAANGQFAAAPDLDAIEKLSAVYKSLPAAEREAKRAQYQEELAEFYAGRRLGESRAAFQARRDGTAPPAAALIANPGSPAGTQEALDIAAKAVGKDGFAPAQYITTPLRYGYSIPQDREYNVAELVAGLRLARAGNLSQDQVNAIIASEWKKA